MVPAERVPAGISWLNSRKRTMAEHVRKICFQSRKASSCKGITYNERSRPIDLIFLIVSLVFFFSLSPQRQAANQDKTPVADQLVGGKFSYVVRSGDSLTGISARFGVSVGVLAADNDLSPSSLLKTGQQLRVDNRHIVPNIVSEQRQL